MKYDSDLKANVILHGRAVIKCRFHDIWMYRTAIMTGSLFRSASES